MKAGAKRRSCQFLDEERRGREIGPFLSLSPHVLG
jgi:hypothetical protein